MGKTDSIPLPFPFRTYEEDVGHTKRGRRSILCVSGHQIAVRNSAALKDEILCRKKKLERKQKKVEGLALHFLCRFIFYTVARLLFHRR